MTRICPKCHYARKPTDDAPDWQCPSCQVAYVKAAGASEAARYRPDLTPSTERAASGTSVLKWGFVAFLVCVGVWAALPARKPAKPAVGVVSEARAEQPAVTMYSTSWCGYCKAARQFFVANSIQFVELDVERSREAYAEHKRLGGRGVPLITIGDDVIFGYNQQRMKQLLEPWMTGS